MGDEKQYIVQIKGTAYKFKPIPTDDLSMIAFVINMNATGGKTLQALTRVLATSAGEEQWDAITDLLIAKKVTMEEVTVKLLEKIVGKQRKEKTPDAPADAQ
jgi:hypothetical protein